MKRQKQITGPGRQEKGCRMPDAGCRMPDAGCQMQDAGCQMQDAGCRMQDAGSRMQDAGCRIPDKMALRIFIMLIILFSLSYHPSTAFSQSSSAFTPAPLAALSTTNTSLSYPWTGGFNACQFCEIDLNLDGISDLLIFDRHGNRRITMINLGKADTTDYFYDPDYALQLPSLGEWVITADYNCDGRMDIFTYENGGIRVFRNESVSTLKFTLVTNLLESFYYTSYIGILVTSVDYPAITDIDGDGDLDLLTFFGLGSYVEYHKNLSMERFGNCDSLDYRLTDPCWGKFKESEGGNRISLNEPCGWDGASAILHPASAILHPASKHTGSTLLALDLNGDGLKDLVLGDMDYPGLSALMNGGTTDSALMVSVDTLFPAAARPVNLFSFPAAAFIDLNNDGLRDLVISPFDPSLATSDNYNSIWYYKNSGSNSAPKFGFITDRLFRSETMDFGSASHPVLFDFDHDGRTDLFVGNEGYYDTSYYKAGVLVSEYISRIAYFRNTGTPEEASFQSVTDDLANLSALHIRGGFPAIGDLNGDNQPDLVTGNQDGTITYFQNLGNFGSQPEFESPVVKWQQIDVGSYSTPQLFDLDKDGLQDLVIGEKGGNFNYYRNAGTLQAPFFELVTDSLGKINVTNYNLSWDGFSTPGLFSSATGETMLAAGSNEGRVRFFSNIDNNLEGQFTELNNIYNLIALNPADTLFGWQSSPTINPLMNLSFEMITGNFSGGLNFIGKRPAPVIIPAVGEFSAPPYHTLTIFPNPANDEVTVQAPGYNGQLFIINFLGQVVYTIDLHAQATIPLTNLSPGIYLLKAGNSATKLIVR